MWTAARILSRARAWLVPLVLVGALACPARAQDEPESGEYWTLIDEAIAEADAGRHGEALVLFRRAHELRPSARTLRAMGLMLYEMRDYVAASRVLAEALDDARRPLEGSERDEVAAAVRRAESFIGTLVLSTRPTAVQITVDGRPVERSADRRIALNPGEHELGVRADGYEPERRTVAIRAGERLDLEVELRQDVRVAAPPRQPTIALVVRSDQPQLTLHAAPLLLGARVSFRSELCAAPCEARVEPGQYSLGVSRVGERPIAAGGFDLREPSRVELLYNDRTGWRVAGFVTLPVTLGAVIALAAAGFSAQSDGGWILLMSGLTGLAGTILTFTWTFLRNSASVRVQPLGVTVETE